MLALGKHKIIGSIGSRQNIAVLQFVRIRAFFVAPVFHCLLTRTLNTPDGFKGKILLPVIGNLLTIVALRPVLACNQIRELVAPKISHFRISTIISTFAPVIASRGVCTIQKFIPNILVHGQVEKAEQILKGAVGIRAQILVPKGPRKQTILTSKRVAHSPFCADPRVVINCNLRHLNFLGYACSKVRPEK